jgi:hypothetical protein
MTIEPGAIAIETRTNVEVSTERSTEFSTEFLAGI